MPDVIVAISVALEAPAGPGGAASDFSVSEFPYSGDAVPTGMGGRGVSPVSFPAFCAGGATGASAASEASGDDLDELHKEA
jgi:hypothetical protein